MRVVAAMSGGVDSAVAAARMIDAGHEVVGVHLALAQSASTLRESARGCCTLEDAGDARRVADRLGIPFYVWDMADRFQADVIDDFVDSYARGETPNPCLRCNEKIKFAALLDRAVALGFDAVATGHYALIDDFVAEYEAGRTPNPCLRCNEKIKFAALLDKALALGFDAVATGHYAQVVEVPDPAAPQGIRRELHRAVDPAKDQSYVLGVLDADQLARSFFPLGDTVKADIRAEAAARGFSVAKKPDSHDICFIADGDTRGWLAQRLGERPGPIVDEHGAVLGEHGGAHGYTVGQRRGLGLKVPSADGSPRYVVSTDTRSNTVVVGPEELLGVDLITADHVRWCGPAPTGEVRVGAQLRAHGEEHPATARVERADGIPERLVVHLDGRTRGVAPGQSVVLYDGTRVVGSGTIAASGRAA